MKPRIALAMQCAEDNPRTFVAPEPYVRFLEHAGAEVVLVSPDTSPANFIRRMEECNGLMIPGGNDIEPWRYRQEPIAGLDAPVPVRDTFELSAVRYALLEDVPYLGICRGCQILNVALGGGLWQRLATGVNHWPDAAFSEPAHEVRLEEGSLLAQAAGQLVIQVNSLHKQAINDLGDNVRAVAFAPDGVVEGIQVLGQRFCLGVQWHPEYMVGTPVSDALGKAFVEACRG